MKTREPGWLSARSRHARARGARASGAGASRQDPQNWQAPSGSALGQFAFRAGFLAGRLLGSRVEPVTDATGNSRREKERWIAGF